MKSRLLLIVLAVFSFQSCYYDKQNELHPVAADPCENSQTAVFNQSVEMILRNNCTSCHSGSNPSGDLLLDNFENASASAKSGKLLSSMKQDGSAVAMPPSSKIRDCEIAKIESWITNGLPEN